LDTTNRIAIYCLATGVGTPFTEGFVAQTSTGRYAEIMEAETIIGSTQVLWIADMNNEFVSGTGLQINSSSSTDCEIQPVYKVFEQAPRRVQIVMNIAADLDSKNDDIYGTMGYDETDSIGIGTFTTDLAGETLTFAQNNKPASMTYCVNKQIKYGDKFRPYIRGTDTDDITISKINICLK
jgi:hypothetical protein